MPTINRDSNALDPAFEDATADAGSTSEGATSDGSTVASPRDEALADRVERSQELRETLPDAAKGPPLPEGVGGDNPDEEPFRPPANWADAAAEHIPERAGAGIGTGAGPGAGTDNGSATNGLDGSHATGRPRRDDEESSADRNERAEGGDDDRTDRAGDGPDAPAVPEASDGHGMADEMVGIGHELGAAHGEGAAHGGARPDDAGRQEDEPLEA